MFDPKTPKAKLAEFVAAMPEIDFARFLYCQHMSATFMSVAQFENMLASAMLACNEVEIRHKLGNDAAAWERLIAKRDLLNASTLGSLIKILGQHDIDARDIAYLKWLKDKRDYFVHRLFHEGAWPGDLDADGCHFMIRRLLAIQTWLKRGERNVWRIFERAGFVELQVLEDGILVMPRSFLDGEMAEWRN